MRNACLLFLLLLLSCSKKVSPNSSVDFKYDRLIYFDLHLDNKSAGHFIYDTGSPYLCIDTLFYSSKKWKHKNIESIKIGGAGNTEATAKMIMDTIGFNIGEALKNSSEETILLDLKSFIGRNIDGIIGVHSFKDKTYKIDYLAEKIIFLDTVVGYQQVDAQFEGNRIYLPLSITLDNGEKIEGSFLVDTGSGNTGLNSASFKTNGIYNNPTKAKFLSKGGVGGNSDGYSLYTKQIMLGTHAIDNFRIDLSTDTLGALADRTYSGVIGNDLLDDFDVVFSYANKKMWIKPNKKFNKNKKVSFRSFSVIDRTDIHKGWIVASVYENSDAFGKGLRLNDVITHINNKSVEGINRREFFNALKPNQNLTLKINRGTGETEVQFKLNVLLRINN